MSTIEYIPVRKIREKVLHRVERGESFREIALQLGYTRKFVPHHNEIADVNRLRRVLGIACKGNKLNHLMLVSTALHMCDKLDISPVDIGL